MMNGGIHPHQHHGMASSPSSGGGTSRFNGALNSSCPNGGGNMSLMSSSTTTKQPLMFAERHHGNGGHRSPPTIGSPSNATTTATATRLQMSSSCRDQLSNNSCRNDSSTDQRQPGPGDNGGGDGIHEMLASLALMCLLALLMAFLALFFLQRSGPGLAFSTTSGSMTSTTTTEVKGQATITGSGSNSRRSGGRRRFIQTASEYLRVQQISVSLSTLTISLNLCCLFVCCIQFLSAIKLLKNGRRRTQEFLKKTSYVRVTAIGAFLMSIPIFFTGVILFTFINFDEVPALATSIVIGVGIVFCGIASVQNVYLWQCEKTRASQELSESRMSHFRESGLLPPTELSTLV